MEHDFVPIFLEELKETLDQWERLCLQASQGNFSDDVFALLFRLAHNTKGSSQSVGLKALGAFVHEVENLIKALRDQKIPAGTLDDWHDVLLESHAILSAWASELALGRLVGHADHPEAFGHVQRV